MPITDILYIVLIAATVVITVTIVWLANETIGLVKSLRKSADDAAIVTKEFKEKTLLVTEAMDRVGTVATSVIGMVEDAIETIKAKRDKLADGLTLVTGMSKYVKKGRGDDSKENKESKINNHGEEKEDIKDKKAEKTEKNEKPEKEEKKKAPIKIAKEEEIADEGEKEEESDKEEKSKMKVENKLEKEEEPKESVKEKKEEPQEEPEPEAKKEDAKEVKGI